MILRYNACRQHLNMFFLYVNTIMFLYCYTVHEKHCKMMDMINNNKKETASPTSTGMPLFLHFGGSLLFNNFNLK